MFLSIEINISINNREPHSMLMGDASEWTQCKVLVGYSDARMSRIGVTSPGVWRWETEARFKLLSQALLFHSSQNYFYHFLWVCHHKAERLSEDVHHYSHLYDSFTTTQKRHRALGERSERQYEARRRLWWQIFCPPSSVKVEQVKTLLPLDVFVVPPRLLQAYWTLKIARLCRYFTAPSKNVSNINVGLTACPSCSVTL